ncbi:MAG: hypothetical protein R2788_11055 [Saprospiraceae bacterium]
MDQRSKTLVRLRPIAFDSFGNVENSNSFNNGGTINSFEVAGKSITLLALLPITVS